VSETEKKPLPRLKRPKDTRRREVLRDDVVETLMAEHYDGDPQAARAYELADAWAHSAPGTPYGGTKVQL
jgi:hypothetical protein